MTSMNDARTRVRAALPAEADLAFRRRVETIIEWIDTDAPVRILDCGSGYGFVLRILRDLTRATIVGLEYEMERVQETRDSLGDDPRLSYLCGDAMQLPFADGSFEYVVCSEVLEHLPDDARATREIFRVLRPGGILIATVPCARYPFAWDPINRTLERVTGKHLGGRRPWSGIWYDHDRLYTREQFTTLMTSAGFAVEESRGLTHHAPPFAHLLLYGIAKPLLRRGLVPSSVRQHVDRHETAPGRPSGLVGTALRALEAIDRPNDDPALGARDTTFVGLAVRARKPVMGEVDVAIS
jgi:SAM-dependent methyltransferase